ncbi:hypothetical protein ACWJJH_15405 [Endozoicomonadaceae bacterium StTr2]
MAIGIDPGNRPTQPLSRGAKVKQAFVRVGQWLMNGIRRLVSKFRPEKKYIDTGQPHYPGDTQPLSQRHIKPGAGSGTGGPSTISGHATLQMSRQVLQQQLKENFAQQLDLMSKLGAAGKLPQKKFLNNPLPPSRPGMPTPFALASEMLEEQVGSATAWQDMKKQLDTIRDDLIEQLQTLDQQEAEMARVIDRANNMEGSISSSSDSSITDSMLEPEFQEIVNGIPRSQEDSLTASQMNMSEDSFNELVAELHDVVAGKDPSRAIELSDSMMEAFNEEDLLAVFGPEAFQQMTGRKPPES